MRTDAWIVKIKKITDIDERRNALVCLYLNSTTVKRCSKMFQCSEEIIIENLKYEGVYEYKLCTKCGRIKAYTEYTKRPSMALGINNECKKCMYSNDNMKARKYARNREPSIYNTYAHQCGNIEEHRRDPNDSNLLQCKCTYCDKWFNPTNSEIANRISVINGNMIGDARLYCSDGCKGECDIYAKIKYRKGFKKTQLGREVQPQLRKLVLERDNWTCQKCNSQDSLHCHHITGIEQNPIESAHIDNCITFCKKCHKEVHKQDGCKYRDLRRCA